jgi:hypothetical protein
MAHATLKYGFRDQRTAAELALSPAPPLSRDSAPPPSKPGKTGVLGAVTNAAKMTSGAFAAAKTSIQARENAVAFSASLTTSAKEFSASARKLQQGQTSIRDAVVFGSANVNAVNSFFNADDLTQFSGMKVGNISVSVSASFAAKLSKRLERIAAMANCVEKV